MCGVTFIHQIEDEISLKVENIAYGGLMLFCKEYLARKIISLINRNGTKSELVMHSVDSKVFPRRKW